MNNILSLSAIGKDRTGIVCSVSKVLFELGCNIEDSTMTLLGGQFAVILLLSCPENSDMAKIKSKLKSSLKNLDLAVSVNEVDNSGKDKKICGDYVIAVYGADKSGIVYNISKYLADNKINITDVQTKISGKAKNGKVYIMLLEVVVPKSLNIEEFKHYLQHLAQELNVEIFVNQADTDSI